MRRALDAQQRDEVADVGVEDLLVGCVRRVADAALFVRVRNAQVLDVREDRVRAVLPSAPGADVRRYAYVRKAFDYYYFAEGRNGCEPA